jgi:hypothetical protein
MKMQNPFKKYGELKEAVKNLTVEVETQKKATALMVNFGGRSVLYDGEKTPNELGNAYNFELDYYTIRMRAWEGYIKSTVIQTAIKNYCLWIVGGGLKFQAEPATNYLAQRGINIGDSREFSGNIEAQFRLYCNSKESVFSKQMNLHILASEALKNAILSGDVLVIERYDGYQPTVQIVDGCFIGNPTNFGEIEAIKAAGNYVVNGVEILPSGEHLAYWVQQDDLTFKRISANPSGSKGKRQAWLLYGLRHKITDTRGMSLLTAVMERDAKLDRYLEASVGAAEENSKIPYTFESDVNGIGDNPAFKQLAQTMGVTKTVNNETNTLNGYATHITQTTGKQVYVLSPGQKLSTNTSHSDPNFNSFYTPNAELIFSTIGIPPEVAMGKYGGSYSGSRAANKSWEFKMKVERVNTLTEYFYKPIYEFWFLINFYKGNIQASGYRDAIMNNDWLILQAYNNCRFIGSGVPHIDPVVEVTAERLKLGSMYDSIPLESGEQASENSDNLDFIEVQKLAEQEIANNYFVLKQKTDELALAQPTKMQATISKIVESSIKLKEEE